MTTQDRVMDITKELLSVPVVLPESRFQDLGADSLDMVDLVCAFEDEFNITVGDRDLSKLVTVYDAVKYIEEKRNANR